jgi:hypothetical protein
MNIRKNDKVTLNQPFVPSWSKHEIPAGTEMIVWRSRRDGTLICSCEATHGMSFYVKADRVTKVVRNCPMPKVGDLFYSSWGYDQTNIDFYQVTTVRNKMVGLTPIAGKAKYDQAMAGYTTPVPNHFTGEQKMHLVRFNSNDKPYFKLNSYSSAWPTKPNSSHFFSEWA